MKNFGRYFTVGLRNIFHPTSLRSGPLHFQVEVTTFCNLACVMCPHPRHIKNPKNMSLEQFKYIFDKLKPLKISMSGIGEPFLNPDMPEMLRYCKKNGASTITTSNLTVVDEKIADEIVTSGLSLLKGSIDSTNPETYLAIRKRDSYNKLLAGLENIRKAKLRHGNKTPIVRLQFVIQKSNYEEIPKVLDLCEEYGIDAINFQPLNLSLEETYDTEMVNELIGDLQEDHLREVLAEAAEKSQKSSVATNLPELYSDFGSVWEKYSLEKVADPDEGICIIPWTSVYITVDGDIRPCCAFPIDQSATLGNIFEDDFLTVWNSERYIKIRRSFREGRRPFKVCQNCTAPTLHRLMRSKFSKYMLFR